MKNKNGFYWEVLSSILFVVGAVLMIFLELLTGTILFIIGFLTSLIVLNNKKKFYFRESFLGISSILSLVIIMYMFFISYSSNIVIISSSFYALNFLIQINYSDIKNVKAGESFTKPVKKVSKTNTTSDADMINNKSDSNTNIVKDAIQDLKKEIKKSEKDYFYTEKGKSFHLGGCISLARTKQDKLKKSKSRNDLIAKGYKTCKTCNS